MSVSVTPESSRQPRKLVWELFPNNSFPQFVLDAIVKDGAAHVGHPTQFMIQAANMDPPEIKHFRV